MGTLNEKNAAMLVIQRKIDTVEAQLNNLKDEKRRMIREFNAPVKRKIEDSIRLFLKQKHHATGDSYLDISDSGISIETGEYEDCNMGGYEGEIVYEADMLKIDEASDEVMVVFRDYCGPNESGEHEESLTKIKLSVLRRIVEHLEANLYIDFGVSPSALMFNGDADYYQKRIEQTDERCDEFGIIPVKTKGGKSHTHQKVSPVVAQAERYFKSILAFEKVADAVEDYPEDEIGVFFLSDDPRQDEFVVSRGEFTDFKGRGMHEIIKTASCMYLHYGKVMVGIKSFYVKDDDGFLTWSESNKIEKVPFAECAEWPYLKKDGTKGMLLDSIIERADSRRSSLAFALPGPREFSTGAYTDDGRYDKTGNLTFKEGITRIEPHCFEGCDKVEVVRIPDGVTEIGESAFCGCAHLRSVYLPKGLVRIGDHAFEGCEKLQKIIFPKGLQSIGDMAFSDCHSLKCVNLPDSLEFLGNNAFFGVEPCYVSHGPLRIEREKIGIDEEAVVIDRTVISRSGIKNSLEDFLKKAKKERVDQSYFAIPEGITELDVFSLDPMFGDFEKPLDVLLPNSLANISFQYHGAEMITTRLSTLPDNPKYDSRGDCNAVIETETDTLVWGCANTIIPDTVKVIGDSAFYSCKGLTGLSIPEGVTTIGESAFMACPYLRKVNFPNSLTEIGEYAFCDCFNLKDIVIPDNVTKIGEDAFGEITIKTVSIPKGLDISGTGLEFADKIIERPSINQSHSGKDNHS